jgi:hypothetical protein
MEERMTSNPSRRSTRFTVTLVAAAALVGVGAPAQADKGFDATCGEVEYRLGSGNGLSSAKKDMDQARGRWGTAGRDNSGPEKTSSGGSFVPVSWTLTVVDSVTGETLLTDESLRRVAPVEQRPPQPGHDRLHVHLRPSRLAADVPQRRQRDAHDHRRPAARLMSLHVAERRSGSNIVADGGTVWRGAGDGAGGTDHVTLEGVCR